MGIYRSLKRHGELLAIIIMIFGVAGALITIYAEEQPGTSASVEAQQMLNLLRAGAQIFAIIVFISMLTVLLLATLLPKLRKTATRI